jgi:hypothetical protein
MRKLGLLIVLSLFLNIIAKSQNIDYLRYLYVSASTNSNSCDSLIDLTKDAPKNDWIKQGYYAIGNMMKSQFVLDPISKFFYFNKGKGILDDLLIQKPEEIELRFLRYCTQKKTPSFLNYNDKIKEDYLFIEASLAKKARTKTEQFIYPIFKELHK